MQKFSRNSRLSNTSPSAPSSAGNATLQLPFLHHPRTRPRIHKRAWQICHHPQCQPLPDHYQDPEPEQQHPGLLGRHIERQLCLGQRHRGLGRLDRRDCLRLERLGRELPRRDRLLCRLVEQWGLLLLGRRRLDPLDQLPEVFEKLKKIRSHRDESWLQNHAEAQPDDESVDCLVQSH